MKYIICFLFCIGVSHSSIGQDKVHSLLKQIKETSNDSVKAEHYKGLFEYYQYTQPDSSVYYLEQGLKYFNEEGYKRGIAVLTGCLGQIEVMRGRHEIAKVKYEEALKIYQELNDNNGIASTNNSLGVIEAKTGHYLKATKYFLTALNKYEEVNNTKGIVNTYLKLGTVNDINNHLDKALEYFNKGLQLSLKVPGDRNTAYLYNSIGVVYCKKQRSDTGLVFFQKALDLSQAPEMLETKIMVTMHMGNAYKDLEEFDKSLEYYYKALGYADPGIMPESHARLLLNIATVKGLTDHKEALALLEKAGSIAGEIGIPKLSLEVQEEMINQYKLSGDYKAAFALLEKTRALEDSIFSLERDAEIANLQSVYELEKSNSRVQQLEAAEEANSLQRNIIIFIACILLLTLILLTLTYSRTNKLNKEMLAREAELQRSNAIKDRIFSIIGHDLRGPIANIPMVIELFRDPRTTAEERDYMLDLLTENSMASLETLDKLLHWGKSQIKGIAIQQQQFRASQNLQHQVSLLNGVASNKGITISNKVPNDTIIFADEDHFNFVIRNLLSNAVKFSHKDSTIVLNADKYSKAGFTTFSVQDSGVGMDDAKQAVIFEAFGTSSLGTNNEGGTSIGLMLCKEFVNENGGEIWVKSEEGNGATFYFSFKNSNN